MNSRLSFSTDFFHELGADELYMLTTHWLSDIAFHELEIVYFSSLIVRYYLPAAENSNLMLLKSIQENFHSLNSRKELLKANILEHQIHLTELMNDKEIQNEAHFYAVHSDLGEKLFDFAKSFKRLKLEFFTATK